MKKYLPNQIEPKWQERWMKDQIYTSDLTKPNKYYILAEFSYPSGDLHMGHWFTYGGADVYARLKRMQGYQVFFPNGFDSFGLPAENAAIKKDVHPQDWTLSNIKRMKEQFSTMGGSFSFDHEVITCLPEYYHWNQWIFLKMYENGLAYKGTYLSNWCQKCQTVLANEGVEAGLCWRCGTEVIQKEVEQWFFKITEYADKLIWPENHQVDWPKSLRDAQNNWIGKSEGALITFDNLEVFTTRPDTLFGATFVVISPEHPLLRNFIVPEQKEIVEKYVEKAKKKSELERKENKEKTGVFTGSFVKNPLTNEQIPVWTADYVLMGYGTGAIMAVPAHDDRDFEFAKKFGLEIKQVIKSEARNDNNKVYESEGVLVNSGDFTGLTSTEAKKKIIELLEKKGLGKKQIEYHLRDWSISRQRYWGTPIPMINCSECGVVPVPESDLPVELPYDVDYTPKGESPLASNKKWLAVKCPKCQGEARREAETMDTFVDSSWYFFRYLDPKLKTAPFEPELAEKMMPVDIYFGGAEHNLGHTLYSRFFTKFFQHLKLISFDEYALKRVNHGIVLGPDGNKMSKSKGNVVNPDDEVKKYGADAVRIHMIFFMPYEGSSGPWVSERIWGPYHFLERVWEMFDKVTPQGNPEQAEYVEEPLSTKDLNMMHKTIKKVGEDIESIKFNTAIAALMEWLNYLSKKESVSREEYRTFLLLLAPFAPHMTEELWQMVHCHPSPAFGEAQNDNQKSIHQQSWPEFDKKYLEEEEVTVAISINGKVRDTLVISKDIVSDKEVVEKMALESPKIQKHLEGRKVQKVVYVPMKIINLVLDSK